MEAHILMTEDLIGDVSEDAVQEIFLGRGPVQEELGQGRQALDAV